MSADNYWAVIPDGDKFAVTMGFESNDEWPVARENSPRFDSAKDALTEAHRMEEHSWTEYGVRLHPDVRAAITETRVSLYREGYDEAVRVFTERFFGGPTKDMVLAWFAEKRPESVS